MVGVSGHISAALGRGAAVDREDAINVASFAAMMFWVGRHATIKHDHRTHGGDRAGIDTLRSDEEGQRT
jgi:hypothetical protein